LKEKRKFTLIPKWANLVEKWTIYCGRLLKPEVKEIIVDFFWSARYAATTKRSSMMDVSDGLVCEWNITFFPVNKSNAGCVLHEDDKKSRTTKQYAYTSSSSIPPQPGGGEDYRTCLKKIMKITFKRNKHPYRAMTTTIEIASIITKEEYEPDLRHRWFECSYRGTPGFDSDTFL